MLAAEHPDELPYQYLYARSTIGRSTPTALQALAAIAADHPDFAPAHKSLAEIYGSQAFADPAREKSERERFLRLCPGSLLRQLPSDLPSPSSELDAAAKLLAGDGDPQQVLRTLILTSVQEILGRASERRALTRIKTKQKQKRRTRMSDPHRDWPTTAANSSSSAAPDTSGRRAENQTAARGRKPARPTRRPPQVARTNAWFFLCLPAPQPQIHPADRLPSWPTPRQAPGKIPRGRAATRLFRWSPTCRIPLSPTRSLREMHGTVRNAYS